MECARHYGPLRPTQRKRLPTISAATLDRLLAGDRSAGSRKGITAAIFFMEQQDYSL